MANYFNTLPLRLQLEQLGKCDFMDESEFANGVKKLEGKQIVVLGCGAQGLNQGLNLRDSGLKVAYALREIEIKEKHISYQNATENGFEYGTFEEMVPKGDLVLNLTPDKYHTPVERSPDVATTVDVPELSLVPVLIRPLSLFGKVSVPSIQT